MKNPCSATPKDYCTQKTKEYLFCFISTCMNIYSEVFHHPSCGTFSQHQSTLFYKAVRWKRPGRTHRVPIHSVQADGVEKEVFIYLFFGILQSLIDFILWGLKKASDLLLCSQFLSKEPQTRFNIYADTSVKKANWAWTSWCTAVGIDLTASFAGCRKNNNILNSWNIY